MRSFRLPAAMGLTAAAVLLLSGCQKTPTITVIDGEKVLAGNQTVSANDIMRLSSGAHLTVDGDLNVSGTLDCDQGGNITITVKKNLFVEKSVTCMGTDEKPSGGIAIVVGGAAAFGKDAVIRSDGNIQIVDDPSRLLQNDASVAAAFDAVVSDSGKPFRIGPIKPSQSPGTPGKPSASVNGTSTVLDMVSDIAHAQPAGGPCTDIDGNVVPDCIQIGGKWVIGEGENPPPDVNVPTPKKGVNKIIVNFNFGPGREVRLENFSLSGPDGRDGKDGEANCNSVGQKGEDAFRMHVNAGKIRVSNFDLTLGSGGNGGNATTKKDCYPQGTAKGGDGGNAGNFKMEADEDFEIEGAFTIHPGTGGNGGEANAYAKDGENGCAGKKGGDAVATGGNGGDNKKELSITGTVGGTENITIDEILGGIGGEAHAFPGKGGNGTGCKCDGGPGGKGTATAGKGGAASFSGNISRAGSDKGGDGGDAESKGGVGGNGGDCNPTAPGGNGGKGGDAVSKEGKGGEATTPGKDGKVIDQTGGDGGNGGTGCGEGKGGKGGDGKPKGNDGKDGKRICLVSSSSSSTYVTPPQSSSSTSTAIIPSSSSSASSSSSKPKTSTGPHVISTIPSDGAGGVAVDQKIQIVFSVPMARVALQSAIAASFSFEFHWINDTTVQLAPTQNFDYDKDYDFRITSSATDTAGHALATSVVVNFRTQKKPTVSHSSSSTSVTQPASSSSTGTSQQTVKALVIGGRKYAISQFFSEVHDPCALHWHAANHANVTSLDGYTFTDPWTCPGYGYVSDVPQQTCTTDGKECY